MQNTSSKTTVLKQKQVFILVLSLILIQTTSFAQFSCSKFSYLFQGSPSTVYKVDLVSGGYVAVKSFNIKINAIGFHPSNNHIYGWDQTNKKIIKIDDSWTIVESIDPPSDISDLNFAVGDITVDGDYILYHPSSDKLYVIDLSTSPLEITAEYSMNLGSTWDLSASPIDGNLYGMNNNRTLYRVNPNTGTATNLGKPSNVTSQIYGACYFDGDGNFYASGNSNGNIFRILSPHSLSSGGTPNATIFAYGPSSSTNDGAKCPYSTISSEGCANFVDDNGDLLVDCDDPLCNSNIACLASGAGAGGLETNDNLAGKIALRDFRNAKFNLNLEDKTYLPKIEGSLTNKRPALSLKNNFNIEDFMPIGSIASSESYDSSPEDLVGLSNALEVASIDAYLGENRVGAVLAIKSDGGVYEHSKYVCDRVKGAQVFRILTEKLDDQHDFPITYFQNINGGREYGTLFSAYVDENNEFVVESHWSTYDYPVKDEYYNFQVWANSISRLKMLSQDILEKLNQKLPIASFHTSQQPEVFVRHHWYENETLNLVFDNGIGAKKVSFEGVKTDSETAARENTTIDIALAGNPLDTVQIPMQLYSLGGTLTYDENAPKDQIFIGNGSWGLNYDKEENRIDQFEVTKSNRPVGTTTENWIERNVSVKGEIQDEITVFRTMQPQARPKDFSAYNTFSLELQGTHEIELVLNKASIKDWSQQPRITFKTDGLCQQFYFSKNDFYQQDGMLEWDDIKSIALVYKGNNETPEPFEAKIRDVAFLSLTEIPRCNTFNDQEVRAYPNPMKEELNMILSVAEVQNYTLYFRNQMGMVIAQQSGQTSFNGSIQFLAPDLPNGMYYYTVEVASGVYSGKVNVTKY